VEKFITMELSTFIFIVLGIYASYYVILILLDRFASLGKSNGLPKQTVYSFSSPAPSMPGLDPAEHAKDLLHPSTYLSSSKPDYDDEDEIEVKDSDLQLIYVPDDDIEPDEPLNEDQKNSIAPPSTSAQCSSCNSRG
jgi:hypothetical protein